MAKLSAGLASLFSNIDQQGELARKAHRGAQVRSMWAECVEEVFLAHTNSVYIIKEGERKILIVYVDESIFAAELNARRELIKLKFLQMFNEELDEFKILISRGTYKNNHPYKEQLATASSEEEVSVPLDGAEREEIEKTVSSIADERLKDGVRKAIIADWEWKKGKGEGRWSKGM